MKLIYRQDYSKYGKSKKVAAAPAAGIIRPILYVIVYIVPCERGGG